MSTENQSAEGAAPAGTGETAQATTTTAPAVRTTVDVSQIPDEALKDRLDRHARSVLNQTLGVKTPEEAKAMREKLAALEKADADRKTAEMTEAQRAMVAAEEATAKLTQLQNELAEERRNAKIQAVLFEKGVKNVDYARFLLERERTAVGADGEGFDYAGALSKAMGDPMTRAAFGIVEGTAQTPTTQVPANTSPAGGSPPRPPTAGGVPDGPKSAKAMTAEEWTAYKRANGMF